MCVREEKAEVPGGKLEYPGEPLGAQKRTNKLGIELRPHYFCVNPALLFCIHLLAFFPHRLRYKVYVHWTALTQTTLLQALPKWRSLAISQKKSSLFTTSFQKTRGSGEFCSWCSLRSSVRSDTENVAFLWPIFFPRSPIFQGLYIFQELHYNFGIHPEAITYGLRKNQSCLVACTETIL